VRKQISIALKKCENIRDFIKSLIVRSWLFVSPKVRGAKDNDVGVQSVLGTVPLAELQSCKLAFPRARDVNRCDDQRKIQRARSRLGCKLLIGLTPKTSE
jgi:hypothetical protein